MKAIRNHGGVKRGHHNIVGLNGRFDTIQAAILLAKFPHFKNEIEARAKIGARYSELIKSACEIPVIANGNTHVYAQYTIRVIDRDKVREKLQKANVPTAIYYPKCLHEQPVFASDNAQYGNYPVSEKASREVLSLPMHPFLDELTQDKIIEAVLFAINT
jgi:UDP-2-acetamido-2-deoxy-ribo-hexuluronate aminotransferase